MGGPLLDSCGHEANFYDGIGDVPKDQVEQQKGKDFTFLSFERELTN